MGVTEIIQIPYLKQMYVEKMELECSLMSVVEKFSLVRAWLQWKQSSHGVLTKLLKKIKVFL